MRTTIALATFLVAGAGAVGVSALDLKGSDTLEGVTAALLTDAALDCGGTTNTPAGTLVYIGTGSGNGETQIAAGAQQVAPMSRFLNASPTCTAADGGFQTTAEGIAFALDGLSIVTSSATGGADACNGTVGTACAPAITKGLSGGGVVLTVPGYVCPTNTDTTPHLPADSACVNGSYKLLDSKDVLRLVYFGLDHDFLGVAQRNCGNGDVSVPQFARNAGLVRAVLVENWGNLFRDPGAIIPGATPPATQTWTNCPGCVRLWHAFRRNDESGTTDTFVTLLTRNTQLIAGGNSSVAIPSINQASRRSLFCNTRQTAGVQCGTGDQGGFDMVTNPNTMPFRLLALATLNASSPGNAEPMMPPTAPGGGQGTQPKAGWDFPDSEFGSAGFAPYYTDFQDFDCIRRECSTPAAATAQEQVCSARGDMGLIIPIWDPPAAVTTAGKEQDPFATTACNGTWQGVRAPACGLVAGVSQPSLCPNGEKPVGAVCAANNPGTCLQPYIGTSPAYDFRCVNNANNFYGGQRRVDGRVYNLHCHSNDTAPNPDYPYCKVARVNPDAVGALQVDMVGAYYRIHQQNFLATARNNHFVLRKAGDFTPLAAGLAADFTPAGGTAACNPTTLLAQGKETSATTLIGCIVGSADRCAIGYAGREAETLAGARSLRVDGVTPEVACVRDFSYPLSRKLYLNTVKGFENVTGDELKMAKCFAQRTIVDPKVLLKGFITLTDDQDAGTQCVDFNEQTACGAASNNPACANNVAPIPQ